MLIALINTRPGALRPRICKNQLISAKFAHHQNGRVVRLIDLASLTIDLKSPKGAFEGKASLEEGKNISSRARVDGTWPVENKHTVSFHPLRIA